MSFEFCSHTFVRHIQATTFFVIFIIYNPNVFQLVFFILQVYWTHVLLKQLMSEAFFFSRNYTVIFQYSVQKHSIFSSSISVYFGNQRHYLEVAQGNNMTAHSRIYHTMFLRQFCRLAFHASSLIVLAIPSHIPWTNDVLKNVACPYHTPPPLFLLQCRTITKLINHCQIFHFSNRNLHLNKYTATVPFEQSNVTTKQLMYSVFSFYE